MLLLVLHSIQNVHSKYPIWWCGNREGVRAGDREIPCRRQGISRSPALTNFSLIELCQHEIVECADVPFGWHEGAAGLIGSRGHAELDPLAHLPVLPVDDIEDFNGIHGVEVS